MKILVVEDNERLADRVKRRLSPHSVDICDTGNAAIRKVSSVDYDVIVLDLGLPDQSGSLVCEKIRKLKIDVPILVLTGNTEKNTIVQLLNHGADDYMVKPFDNDELKARVSALGRRLARRLPSQSIQLRDLTINSDTRSVMRSGVVIDLRKKEYEILNYLVINAGRILTREMIISHIWDEDKVGWVSTVDVHIKHLRDKVDKPFAEPLIKTAYGIGYFIDDPK
jgi:DNA-binding response OmpR family regulator